MAGSDQRSRSGKEKTIIWVGKSDIDPYWNRCSDRFTLCACDTIYDAVAEVLIDKKTAILVLNAVALGAELRDLVKILISNQLFDHLFLYSTASNVLSYIPNGDRQVVFLENVQQVYDQLELLVAASDSPTENRRKGEQVIPKESPRQNWPIEPPVSEMKRPRIIEPDDTPTPIDQPPVSEPQKQLREPESQAELPSPPPSENPLPELQTQTFDSAHITPEELQALLGPDFEINITQKDKDSEKQKP